MERNRKVVLPLTEAEWQALVAKARSEDRTPDLQAMRILRRSLRLSGGESGNGVSVEAATVTRSSPQVAVA